MTASASFAASAQRGLCATFIALGALVVAGTSDGQAGQVPAAARPVPADGQQPDAPINPQSLSCNALKSQLKTTGALSILAGPKGGWPDTFYGPTVPRCEFWQMPVFTYVRAGDGLCGLGYICVDKLSFD